MDIKTIVSICKENKLVNKCLKCPFYIDADTDINLLNSIDPLSLFTINCYFEQDPDFWDEDEIKAKLMPKKCECKESKHSKHGLRPGIVNNGIEEKCAECGLPIK